ncbi:hypothetical protein, partial [Burkholderia multivorans]|uniref:hypothetical protein n=1 Tax=Burkholderia multivorans TaxID=87883 RepID=UPI001C660AA3
RRGRERRKRNQREGRAFHFISCEWIGMRESEWQETTYARANDKNEILFCGLKQTDACCGRVY